MGKPGRSKRLDGVQQATHLPEGTVIRFQDPKSERDVQAHAVVLKQG